MPHNHVRVYSVLLQKVFAPYLSNLSHPSNKIVQAIGKNLIYQLIR